MNWISVLDALYGPICYLIVMPMINQVLRPKRSYWWMLGVAVYVGGGTFLFRLIEPKIYPISPVLQVLLMLLPAFVLYPKERFSRKLYCSLILFLGEAIAIPLSTFLVGMLTNHVVLDLGYATNLAQLARNGLELILLIITSGVLLLPLWRGRDVNISWFSYALFIASQGFVIMLCAFLISLINNMAPQVIVLLTGVALCVTADVFLYQTMHRDVKNAQIKAENEVLRQLQQMQLLHSETLHRQQEKMSILRHDTRNHLHVLRILMDKDAEESKAYLSKLIDLQQGDAEAVFCANKALNALLYAKSLDANQQDIRLGLEIKLPPQLPLDDVDLVGIFGNLLDNAIAACSEVKESTRRTIHLETLVMAGHLRVRCTNAHASPAAMHNGIPARASGEERGWGVQSIMHAAARYGGHVDFEQDDASFTAAVVLPLDS